MAHLYKIYLGKDRELFFGGDTSVQIAKGSGNLSLFKWFESMRTLLNEL